ncbi:MAG: pilin [Patescibacteria group bacterium]|nr:pilin [Patescibacteria group bacterium]
MLFFSRLSNKSWLAISCFLLVLVVLLLTPALTFAQDGIVPCKDGCGFADLIQLIKNLLGWFVMIAVPVATMMIVYAGALLVTAPTDTGKRVKAKSVFKVAVIGLVAVLAAWLIVDTILNELTGTGIDQRTENISSSAPPLLRQS